MSDEKSGVESGMDGPARPRTGSARRAAWLAALAVVVVAGGLLGARRWTYSKTHVSSDNAQVDAHIVSVLAKVGGYVDEVLVAENQVVHRGETIVVVDDAELKVRLAEAEADLAAARAAAGTDGVQGQVQADASATLARRQALEARLDAVRANHERTRRDLVRTQELADKSIASRQQLDAAQATFDATAADVIAVERDVAAARAAETSASAAGRAAEARLARAEATLVRAQLDLSYAHVVAPVSGVVSRMQAEVGQLLQPGQPLGAVVADSAIWITANLKETETSDVRAGQSVEIDVDAYPDCPASGSIVSVSPATGSKFALLPPDNATGNFTKVIQRIPVRIAIDEGCGADRPLRPGMSVVVHIQVG
ncbi:MAG: HlyD family secretion protein [Longimicrobiales bacterium]